MKYFQKLKLFLAGLLLGGTLAFAGAPPAHAALFDSAKGDACEGATLGVSSDCTNGAAGTLTSKIKAIINLFSIIIGIVAVIMIIVAGFRYITSGGDSGNVTNAKNTLLYAVVGLVVAALAQVIVKFVLAKAV